MEFVEKIKKEILEHERNNLISYNEDSHTYVYNCEGRKIVFDGVTSWIGKYTKPFDKSIAKFIAYRDGITEEDVLKSWDMARGYGKYLDKLVGDYINYGKFTDQPEVQNFIQAMEEKELTPLVSEWTIYDESIKRASNVDLVCADKEGKLVIVDLKSMEKDIKYHGYKGQTMSYPIDTLEDSKYYKQALQVGIYKLWIERLYNLPTSDNRYVLRIRPEFYEWIPLMDVETEIDKIYDFEQD